MKKIVILSAFLSPYRSGAEACVEEVSALLKNRYDLTIVTARLDRALPAEDVTEGGVRVVRVGLGHPIDKWLFPVLGPLAARRLKPDVLHAVLESYAGLALVKSRVLVPGARRLLTCQSTNTRLLLRMIHRAAHRVTAISTPLVERARRFGAPAVLIPNGIPLAAIEQERACGPRRPRSVLFVGRLEPMKGVDTLLRAFARLPAEASLRIVGEGSLRDELERLAGELRLGDRVTFTGRLTGVHVLREYANAEIFCGLSRSEALGNVFLEAQASGCAVVATRVGGIPDAVQDGETGLLVPPDDVDAAADALRMLLGDAALRVRLGEAGRTHAAAYDWAAIAERYAAVYDTL